MNVVRRSTSASSSTEMPWDAAACWTISSSTSTYPRASATSWPTSVPPAPRTREMQITRRDIAAPYAEAHVTSTLSRGANVTQGTLAA